MHTWTFNNDHVYIEAPNDSSRDADQNIVLIYILVIIKRQLEILVVITEVNLMGMVLVLI